MNSPLLKWKPRFGCEAVVVTAAAPKLLASAAVLKLRRISADKPKSVVPKGESGSNFTAKPSVGLGMRDVFLEGHLK